MTRKLLSFLLPVALFSMSAFSQNNGGGAAPATATGSKVGIISIQDAIVASNEGQRDFEALSKKLEPKQTELKNVNDEIEGLKKQLNTQGEKLNEQTRSSLVKQIEQKQKSLDRSVQDARDTVVFVAVNLYLQAVTGSARITAAQAQVTTSQALYNLAADQRKAGVPSLL